jgi:hypothetical protein
MFQSRPKKLVGLWTMAWPELLSHPATTTQFLSQVRSNFDVLGEEYLLNLSYRNLLFSHKLLKRIS